MENSSFKKQAKSDIFKELYPIINFYIRKGAKPNALKRYYKNTKRFNDLLDDIKNKGVNLIKDDQEYKKLVRDILNDILDDFITKCKDEDYKNKESKMKHIKEFYSFQINELKTQGLKIPIYYTIDNEEYVINFDNIAQDWNIPHEQGDAEYSITGKKNPILKFIRIFIMNPKYPDNKDHAMGIVVRYDGPTYYAVRDKIMGDLQIVEKWNTPKKFSGDHVKVELSDEAEKIIRLFIDALINKQTDLFYDSPEAYASSKKYNL